MPNSPEKRSAIKHLRNPIKNAFGVARGDSSPATESLVVSVARRLIHKLNGEELTLLASGVVPESIHNEAINAELHDPTVPSSPGAMEINYLRNYRWGARGADLWMRENKAEINATIAQSESASADSSQAPLKGSLLKWMKKRVGWRLFRLLPKEEQDWWIVRAREERNFCGFKPILAPDDEPEGDVGTPKPKRKLDSSTPALKTEAEYRYNQSLRYRHEQALS